MVVGPLSHLCAGSKDQTLLSTLTRPFPRAWPLCHFSCACCTPGPCADLSPPGPLVNVLDLSLSFHSGPLFSQLLHWGRQVYLSPRAQGISKHLLGPRVLSFSSPTRSPVRWTGGEEKDGRSVREYGTPLYIFGFCPTCKFGYVQIRGQMF